MLEKFYFYVHIIKSRVLKIYKTYASTALSNNQAITNIVYTKFSFCLITYFTLHYKGVYLVYQYTFPCNQLCNIV